MENVEAVINRIEEILPEIEKARHDLHRIPEAAFCEKKTSAFIRSYLEKLDLDVLPPYAETDVPAILEGAEKGKTIMLRADIDALPIIDRSGVPYSSEHHGFSHSCGHDGHIAVLLGAAKILSEMRSRIKGKIKFLFQPGEESEAGGMIMVKRGFLSDDPAVDEAYALHCWPGIETGHAESCCGPIMAATDDFEIVITGSGGHGAMPHLAQDIVSAAAQFIISIQSIVSRMTDPLDPAVISVCMIKGGDTFNVIPGEIVMRGTLRYLRKETGVKITENIKTVLKSCMEMCGGEYRIEHPKTAYIPVVNEKERLSFVASVAEKYLGKGCWSSFAEPSMCGDDFGYFLDKVPGVYFRLGIGADHSSLHTPEFDFNDDALKSGIALMCGIALEQ